VIEQSGAGPGSLTLRGTALTVDPATRADRFAPLALVAPGAGGPASPLRVVARPLGFHARDTGPVPLDRMIIEVADKYAIPPQVLKSQMRAESQLLRRNFRYEPLTIDVRDLTGDRYNSVTWASVTAGGQRDRKLLIDPVHRYATADASYLVASATPAMQVQEFTFGQAALTPRGAVLFRLGEPVKRDGPQATNVNAEIVLSDGRIEPLALIREITVWTKAGPSYVDGKPAPTFQGRISSPTGSGPGGAPGAPSGRRPGEFSVRYREGDVYLYRSLVAGERLRVRFYDLGAQARATVPAAPDAIPPPNLEDRGLVRGQFPLRYPATVGGAPTTLTQWFSANFDPSNNGRWWGNWLTGTAAERALHFEVDANQHPVRPVDPRFDYITPQFVAGATYGALQIGIQRWLTTTAQQSRLNRILNGTQDINHATPVHSILPIAREHIGLELGASEHREERRLNKRTYCESCTMDQWLRFWTDVLRPWNPSHGAPEYSGIISNILRQADRYVPR
jgi:hypothetical protein